ncbi:MAG: hypothetical protein LHW51_04680 [Candidatus Cloacimonetes bacterium]|nr:hypothetical protein [Candidatus Cloacimonadota bacterium]
MKSAMADLIFTGELRTSKAGVKAKLDLYSFIDEGVYIVYCPALDLSGYGHSIEDAKESFSEVFQQHITYCINKNTLHEDLLNHGWNVRGKKSKDIKAPKLEELLKKNEAFRDVLNKDYSKFNTEIEFAS